MTALSDYQLDTTAGSDIGNDTPGRHKISNTPVVVRKIIMDSQQPRCKQLDSALERGIVYAFDVIRAERGRGKISMTRAVSLRCATFKKSRQHRTSCDDSQNDRDIRC